MRSHLGLIPRHPADAGEEILDCDDYALQLKTVLTVLTREWGAVNGRNAYPPAVGIVLTATHAVSLFVSGSRAGPKVWIADASRAGQPVIGDPDAGRRLLQALPVRLIYM